MVTGLLLTIVQKKSKHTSVKAKHKSLSVQFSLDGFSFCILNNETQKPISFTEYVFDETLNPEYLLQRVEDIFSSDKDLQQEFVAIKAIHQNNLATLVPNKYFDESKLKTYLDYNIKTLATDFIAFDDLQKTTTKNVYVPYININNYLFQNFGEFEYKHHATELIDSLLLYSEGKNENKFYVHVSKNNEYTVLGVLAQEGQESQLFEFLESFLPIKEGKSREIHKSLDLSTLFPKNNDFYSYGGSLTTPPCTENVNWVIFKEPIIVSVEEVIKLKNNMPKDNYRNEQPLNNRLISLNEFK